MPDTDAAPPRSPADSGRDNQRWLQLWRDQQLCGFHQLIVTPLLSRFWPALGLSKRDRVLVPLCGKSLDMLWLAEQGHEVVGVELSPVAVEAFFRENGLKARKQRMGNFVRWRAGRISVWCGDYFRLTRQQLGRIDAVLDRAALTALPEDIRGAYLEQLMSLTQADTAILLFTVEDIEEGTAQRTQAVDRELGSLCAGSYSIQLLHAQAMPAGNVSLQASHVTLAKAYRLSR